MSFARKMSKVSLRSFIFLFNIFGMLSINFNENKLKSSRIFSVVNLLKMPIVMVGSIIFGLNIKLRHGTLKRDLSDVQNYSTFTTITFIVSGQLLVATLFFVSLLSFFRYQDILKFMNHISRIDLDNAHSISLQKRWRKHFISIAIIFVIFSGFQFATRMKIRWISLAVYPLVMYPHLEMTVFMSFLKAIEIFFVTLMSNFSSLLRISRQKMNFEVEDYQNLKFKYNQIHELNKIFHKAFGGQIAAATFCIITMTTLHVSQCLNLF